MWADPGLAGSDIDIPFLAGVSVTESQGIFSKEVLDCGDCGLREQLGEDGPEISIGVSWFCTSFGVESGLSPGKGGMSPGERSTSGKCETSPVDWGAPLGDWGAPLGDHGTSLGDCGAPVGDWGAPLGDCGASLGDHSVSLGDCGT